MGVAVMIWNDRTVQVRRFLEAALGRKQRDRVDYLPDSPVPGPQEQHENVEFMAEALRGLPKPKTVFDCIGPDGKISDEGWGLLDLTNPHKRMKQ